MPGSITHLMIPFLDFGGFGPPLHFAHANGYSPKAYTPFIETLTPRYRASAMLSVHPSIPGTLRRRRVFESVETMFDNYRRKPVFNRIDDRGLRAYVEALARPRPDGQVALAYSPEWEATIYMTGPLYEWKLWPQLKELRPPLLIVRGQETDTFFPSAARMVKQRLPQAIIHTVPGTGHLLPMEKPEEVSRVIFDFLDKI